MKTVEDYGKIRKEYYLQGKSIREIHRETGIARETIRKMIIEPEPEPYHLEKKRPAPVLGAYKERISELLKESETLPRKQRYTGKKIYQIIQEEGYQGSEGHVINYVCQQRRAQRQKAAYIPLEFDSGQDAQVDWGEVIVRIAGKENKVQFFTMRLNYSKARFVMAFPYQKQEAFLEGHIAAFHFFGGVPRHITYDNLKTAVYKVLKGRKRDEQQAFKTFRSYYLYESRYCNPGKGNEKGGVENDVGYSQRNFFSPIIEVDSYETLNNRLRESCLQDLHRRTRGQMKMVSELMEDEKKDFLPMPERDFKPCVTRVVKPNSTLMVSYETNRYSIPYEYRSSQLVLSAFAFRIEIQHLDKVIAVHPRSFLRHQDILNPNHYLPLLHERPGAFEHAKPIRKWRQEWPESYERLLQALQKNKPEGAGIREFVCVLKLHLKYPPNLVEKAVDLAVGYGACHFDGVQLCLRSLVNPQTPASTLDLEFNPDLNQIGHQPVNLEQYDQLVGRSW